MSDIRKSLFLIFVFALYFFFLENEGRFLKKIPHFDGQKKTIHLNKKLAFDGYNLTSDCRILDMQGELIAQYPGRFCQFFSTGEVVSAMGEKRKLTLLSSTGDILWQRDKIIHHDILIYKDQFIYALSHELRPYKGRNVLFNTLLVLDKKGNVLKEWSTYDSLKNLSSKLNFKNFWLEKPPITKGLKSYVPERWTHSPAEAEYFHVNSIDVFEKNFGNGFFEAGDVLLSFTRFNFYGVFSHKDFQLKWFYRPFSKDSLLRGNHSGRITKEGNFILFLNGTNKISRNKKKDFFEGTSSIIELNPLTKKVIWSYGRKKDENFFSHAQGEVQRLENGNTLITSIGKNKKTGATHSFEVSPKGKIVWAWFNNRRDPITQLPFSLQYVRRYPKEKFHFLD